MDRQELAAFLRSRRERSAPTDTVTPASRRRTPGLRRDEVAGRAFISLEYYTRLEQARAPRPSSTVLAALAHALQLNSAETSHLYRLAGGEALRPPRPPTEVSPGIDALIHRLSHAAIIVVSATYEVIAWNQLACALMEDFSALDRDDRNVARRAFLSPARHGHRLWGLADPENVSRICALQLRAAAARYPDDPETVKLIDDLRAGSDAFDRLWRSHDVGARTEPRKTFDHPMVGPITLNCDTLDIADRDQRMFVYTAEPGSPDEGAFTVMSARGARQPSA